VFFAPIKYNSNLISHIFGSSIDCIGFDTFLEQQFTALHSKGNKMAALAS
jgi:hypothetical protein